MKHFVRCINTTLTLSFHTKTFHKTTIYTLFSLEVESAQWVLNWTLRTLFTWSEWVTGGPAQLYKHRIELTFTLGEKGLARDDSHSKRWFSHLLRDDSHSKRWYNHLVRDDSHSKQWFYSHSKQWFTHHFTVERFCIHRFCIRLMFTLQFFVV